VDNKTPEARSYNMSRIRSKDTAPEETVRKYLFSRGFRYRKNDNRLPGKPDIVLPKYKTVIFVNGCFWHKHEGCKYFVWPKSNQEFWHKKISATAERDKKDYQLLKEMGWRVLVVWECELKKPIIDDTLNALAGTIMEPELHTTRKRFEVQN
jgi:DNA mismatch endonuclease (patch repair protein)